MGGAWMSLNKFRTKNHGRISETFTNYEARLVAQVSQTLRSRCIREPEGFDAPIGVLAWESVDHVLTYSGRQIAAWIMSNTFRTTNRGWISKPSRITRQRLVAHVSQTRSVRDQSGFDAPIESSWHGRSVDHVLTYSGRQIAIESQKTSRIMRQKTCLPRSQHVGNLHELRGKRLVAQVESNTSVRVVFRNRSGLMLRLESSWHGERGSCLNIFWTTNPVDLCKLHEYRQKTCCASESNTSVPRCIREPEWFCAPIGVVLAWEERGSCLNIPDENRGWISETFTNYEAKTCCVK
ncbi:uncharacterized protein G2W53_010014 [Senna tora]|uniref:Uncharacterized protein n=1 Tax=Senna tora TaxID=362788 RepID=A0A835CAU6_9FABA|nr:uncharacterized protein G2W53_010014 [Senna tora]